MRDHQPAPIEAFNGYFNRGDVENTPVDHFQASNNLRHIGKNIATRDGITISQDVNAVTPLTNIRRIYNYPTITQNTQLVLSYNPTTNTGAIYHVVDAQHQFGPILSIVGMTDFAFVPFGGRAYISPFSSVPPTVDPPTPLTAATTTGTGLSVGVYKYAVTFVTASGETTGSADSNTIITASTLIDPAVSLTSQYTVLTGSNGLTIGFNGYIWKVVYLNSLGQHTLGSSGSPAFNSFNPNAQIGLQTSGAAPAGVASVQIYRNTQANPGTFYLESTTDIATFNAAIAASANFVSIGGPSDATIAANATIPGSNNTANIKAANLTNITVGTAGLGVTKRKIYRTIANGSSYLLLTTINDNVTTTFADTTADGSLGAGIPTINTATLAGDNVEKGLSGQFLYVYAGDGTNARKAAGVGMTGSMTVAAGVGGNTDTGVHIYGIVSVTRSGYQSPPTNLTTFTNTGTSVSFGNIPTSGDPNVISRQIVVSKAITNFDGNLEGYDLFFLPNGVINNNTDTFLNNVSFFDTDLIADASHLLDNYTSIPAGAFLTLYHGRLILGCTNDDINLVLVSTAGEPEAISQISGLLSTQPNGFPVSNAAEFRDVLYVFRPNSGMSFTDNQGDPSSWPLVELEGALGARPHAIGQYLNSQTQSVDYLVIATYQGISVFTGGFQTPELSWKIETFWKSLDRTQFGLVQVIINTVKKRIYVILPNLSMLVGFIQNGTDPTSIQWEPWTFTQPVNTICVTDIDEDLIGCDIY